ncbi:MAG: hypothetical protein M3R57_07770 [Chloroflexota bacterium]|nr:hypothetical protein [Chloroflexota bacterium]
MLRPMIESPVPVLVFSGGYTIPGEGSPALAKRTIERELVVGPPNSNGSRQTWNSTTIIEVHTPK